MDSSRLRWDSTVEISVLKGSGFHVTLMPLALPGMARSSRRTASLSNISLTGFSIQPPLGLSHRVERSCYEYGVILGRQLHRPVHGVTDAVRRLGRAVG